MSYDTNLLLAPYVVCKVSDIEKDFEKLTCTNVKCINHGEHKSTNFCSTCGSKIGKVSFKKKESCVNYSHVQIDLLKESLCVVPGDQYYSYMKKNNIHFWISNRLSFRCLTSGDCSDLSCETQPTEITPELISLQIEKFKSHYKKEIDILNDVYGKDNVEIKFGLIVYSY